MSVGRLATRAVVGGFFVGHGLQKLKGWFGGPGPDGTAQMMDSIGLRPPRRNALAVGVTETAGGAMLAAGLATPLAAAGLIGVMASAIRTVHAPNGPWNTNGGWEYNAVLISTLALIAEEGPGRLSLDALSGMERRGPKWGVGAVALGVASSIVVVECGRRAEADGQDSGDGDGEATGDSGEGGST